jgi:hypothetical protein
MPIEREYSKIVAMPDDDLFRWRTDVRLILSQRTDAELSALFEASLQEIVHRAGQAWAVVKSHSGRGDLA